MYMYTEGLQIGHIQIVTKSYSMYIQKYHDKSVLNKELNFHIPIKIGFGVILLLRTIEANTKIKIKLVSKSKDNKSLQKVNNLHVHQYHKENKNDQFNFFFRINVYDFLSVSIYAVCYFIYLVVFVLW